MFDRVFRIFKVYGYALTHPFQEARLADLNQAVAANNPEKIDLILQTKPVQNLLNRPFIEAATSGDIAKMEMCERAQIVDEAGMGKALSAAVNGNQGAAVDFLLASDKNRLSQKAKDAVLVEALNRQRFAFADRLAKAGADVNADRRLLQDLTDMESADSMRWALSHGYNMHVKSGDQGDHTLIYAIRHRKPDLAAIILDAGERNGAWPEGVLESAEKLCTERQRPFFLIQEVMNTHPRMLLSIFENREQSALNLEYARRRRDSETGSIARACRLMVEAASLDPVLPAIIANAVSLPAPDEEEFPAVAAENVLVPANSLMNRLRDEKRQVERLKNLCTTNIQGYGLLRAQIHKAMAGKPVPALPAESMSRESAAESRAP